MPRLLAVVCGVLLAACSTMQPISRPGMKAYELVLATSGDHLAVAWHGSEQGHDAIYLQWLRKAGQPDGASIRISDGERYAYEPDMQLIDGQPVLTWYEKDAETGELSAWLVRTDREGHVIWRRALSAAGGAARNPVVRFSGGVLFVAWIETPKGHQGAPSIWIARFDGAGNQLGGFRRAGDAGADTWNLNAAVNGDGVFYVVYDAQLNARANELHMLVISDGSIVHRQLSADDGNASVYPDLGISESGQAALTWFDDRDGNEEVYLGVLSLEDLIAGRTPPSQRITHTSAKSIGAYLAWNGERVMLVWCDADGGQQELYVQAFNAAGVPLNAIRRLTNSQTQSSIPSIKAWKSGFVVAWNEYEVAGEGLHRTVISSEARQQQLN